MLDEFKPQLVDKEFFVNHYNNTRLDIVIEDMGWISEAYKNLHSLEMIPKDKPLQEKVWASICGVQHDLPLGKEADLLLQELKTDLQKSNDYHDIQRYVSVLDDLMQGYRKVLKKRHEEL